MDFSIELLHEEKSVIDAAIRKEKWAQKFIYEEHFGQMMGVCMRYARDEHEAMDLLHDGFIKVFKYLNKYKAGTSLQAWIKRVMINNCIDHFRKSSRKRTEDLDNAVSVSDNSPDVISRISEEDIIAAMHHLSPIYRTVFNMYVIEGYSHREIGERLGISESTSRSNLVKARGKLKDAIAKLRIQSRYE